MRFKGEKVQGQAEKHVQKWSVEVALNVLRDLSPHTSIEHAYFGSNV